MNIFKLNIRKTKRIQLIAIVFTFVFSTFSFYFIKTMAATCSTVSDCQAQINNLNSQNAQNSSSVSSLQMQAQNYQQALAILQQQITGIQTQINANLATQASIQSQMTQNQNKLDQQKTVLASDVKSTYVNGSMTTLEQLASSKDLSDYVNAATYRNAISDSIQKTLDEINALQAKLKTQKSQVDQLLAIQTTQQNQLTASRNQQTELLSYNQQQQDQYNQQLASNNASIAQLRSQLAALNTPAGSIVSYSGVCGGGYPGQAQGPQGIWGCEMPQDNTFDNWGLFNRECVSYASFKVHQEYMEGKVKYDMPYWGGVGNAYQWIDDASNYGIPVDQTPHVGDIAIRPRTYRYAGDVGHAMYVESVNGDGTITVSQYNANLTGQYSVATRSTSGLYFIHFQQWQ